MNQQSERMRLLLLEFDRLYEDCSYSAQTYLEAAKSAELWGKAMVWIPALVGAVSSALVAVGQPKAWSALGAVAGAVAATASFLGSDRKASAFKEAGRRFTVLRHASRAERTLGESKPEDDLELTLRGLREQYGTVVSANELASNRFFRRAHRRIAAGALSYAADQTKGT